jgi:hypothetical protein
MTLHDDEARKTATFSREVLPQEWISREGRVSASLPRKTKSGTEKTKVAGIRPPSVSPQLRDAILGLHRDDPLRRTYLRRYWTSSSEFLAAQINEE